MNKESTLIFEAYKRVVENIMNPETESAEGGSTGGRLVVQRGEGGNGGMISVTEITPDGQRKDLRYGEIVKAVLNDPEAMDEASKDVLIRSEKNRPEWGRLEEWLSSKFYTMGIDVKAVAEAYAKLKNLDLKLQGFEADSLLGKKEYMPPQPLEPQQPERPDFR